MNKKLTSGGAPLLISIVATKPLWAPLVGAMTHSTVTFDVMDIVVLLGAALVWYGDKEFGVHEN